ncbi:hypothetical protein BDN70DRAFT_888870 [Pholiota conissans]|uniref:Uncharacterized protein n=1 Tax=Pholiota conissans TaxID=109636 RepID=A0A9P5YN77_9AGAR|nr:hypothetical protein BDN70DRAFT_888870 [Pholiota conissans]
MEFAYPAAADTEAAPSASDPVNQISNLTDEECRMLRRLVSSETKQYEAELYESAQAVTAKVESGTYCRAEIARLSRIIVGGPKLRRLVDRIDGIWTIDDRALFTAQGALTILKARARVNMHDAIDRDFATLASLANEGQAPSLEESYSGGNVFDEKLTDLANRFEGFVERSNALAGGLAMLRQEGELILERGNALAEGLGMMHQEGELILDYMKQMSREYVRRSFGRVAVPEVDG